jgi:hypothetical protein
MVLFMHIIEFYRMGETSTADIFALIEADSVDDFTKAFSELKDANTQNAEGVSFCFI